MENGESRSNTQACAACKYQRRKCGPHCILAPYFPHDRQKQFLNAHKLFGVGKITNMIRPLLPSDRDIAIKTIIYQSDMRANDPAGGCLSYIQRLQSQIEYTQAELRLVLQYLAFFKAQTQTQPQVTSHHPNFVNATTPQPFVQQMSRKQHYIHYNHPPQQHDPNFLAIENSIPMSSLSLQDMNQERVDDQQSDVDLMQNMSLDSNPTYRAGLNRR